LRDLLLVLLLGAPGTILLLIKLTGILLIVLLLPIVVIALLILILLGTLLGACGLASLGLWPGTVRLLLIISLVGAEPLHY
jgi:hypothetical protein